MGIGRYEGSVTSTKLKVTGIDLFSAGNFVGASASLDVPPIVLERALDIHRMRVVTLDQMAGAAFPLRLPSTSPPRNVAKGRMSCFTLAASSAAM